MLINNEEELEERLSRPNDADIAAMASLQGDVMILGAGGKMGPSLAKLARRSADSAKRIIAVARFTSAGIVSELNDAGVETIACDLLAPGTLGALPDVTNVVFMAARKFGTAGAEHLTWAMNTHLPGLVAERFKASRIVAFSTGNVYPLRPAVLAGAHEDTAVGPSGEYAQSALGRERMFAYGSEQYRTPVTILRLNYAVDLRYGVLVDIGLAVLQERPVDLRMGLVNVIWQGDANSWCLRSFAHCDSPPFVLNITGPETLSVREIALDFGRRFGKTPVFSGEESSSALLNDAARAHRLFGYPRVTAGDLMDWVSHWLTCGAPLLGKPTQFQRRDGQF